MARALAFLAGWLLATALLGGGATAQSLDVLAPPDRFVAPGDFATLVFRVAADAAVDADASVDVDLGWSVVRPPGRLALRAGERVPVAVTVAVPADAPAAARAAVRLTAAAGPVRAEAVVVLTVTERAAVDLAVPSEAALGGEGFEAVVINAGNVPEALVVVLSRDGRTVAERTVVLAPGAREAVRFVPEEEGLYQLRVTSDRGGEVRRSVRVVAVGAPALRPFHLQVTSSAGVDLAGRWSGDVTVRGPLSDFASLDVRADAAVLERSFAELDAPPWTVRLGAQAQTPFGLRLPRDVAAAALWDAAPWGAGASVGVDPDGRVGGYAAVRWRADEIEAAAAAGWHAAAPLAALRGAFVDDAFEVVAEARWQGGALDAGVEVETATASERSAVRVEAHDVGRDVARLAFGVMHRVGPSQLYADATAPIGSTVPWGGRVGVREELVTPLPGTLDLALQAGSVESFARLGYRAEIGGGWRVTGTGGVRRDASGFGVTLDATLGRGGDAPIELQARLTWPVPGGPLGGRLGAQAQVDLDPLALSLAAGWDLDERDVAASAAIGWGDETRGATLDATLGYGYGGALAGAGWRADVRLSGRWTWDVAVPAAVTRAAGGYRLGTVEGRVATDAGEGLAGVPIRVGRFEVETDADGRFRFDLPPGRYEASVDATRVPIAYQLAGPANAIVDVPLRESVRFDVAVRRTAALTGFVRLDSDGDGRPDEPPRAVAAQVLVVDADGLARRASLDSSGAFEVRGLPPGPARVRVAGLPLGASLVGEAERTVVLEAGSVATVGFAVRPRPAAVAAFGGAALRVRSVAFEVDRVPPGAAPLVRVEAAGAPDRVEVEVAGVVHPLARDGEGWSGRVQVPADSVAIATYVVRAFEGDDVAERRGQLLVDPAAPLIEVSSDAPARAGEALALEVATYFAAQVVMVDGPYGASALQERSPGRWVATLAIPRDAADGVVTLTVRAVAGDGAVAEASYRFRVLAP